MEPENTQPRSAVVFLIDGLNPLYLSPHGCTWIETPALDSLAAASVVFERALTESSDAGPALFSFLSARHPLYLAESGRPEPEALGRCRRSGISTILLTDDQRAASELANEFEQVIALPDANPESTDQLADEIGETHLARCFARVLHEMPLQVSPFLMVVHLTSLVQVWDAPLAMRARHRDEEDPEPSNITVPPRQSGNFDPDEILGVSHAYAAQIETLDTCLGVLMEETRLDGLLGNTLVSLVGQRGFPMGYSGQFNHDPRYLGSDSIRVPLMIRFPDLPTGEGAFFRTHQLTPVSEGFRFVCDWLTEDAGSATATDVHRLIAGLPDTEKPYAIACSQSCQAMVTPAWLLIHDDDEVRLYVQPDDRWDVNSVHDRCRGIAEDLRQFLESACTQLRRNGSLSTETLADELVYGLK